MSGEWIPSCARATFTFGKRRPGQWTDRTRDKRRKRLAKAAYRRDVARMFNARGREWRVLGRKDVRQRERESLDWRAREIDLDPTGKSSRYLRILIAAVERCHEQLAVEVA